MNMKDLNALTSKYVMTTEALADALPYMPEEDATELFLKLQPEEQKAVYNKILENCDKVKRFMNSKSFGGREIRFPIIHKGVRNESR